MLSFIYKCTNIHTNVYEQQCTVYKEDTSVLTAEYMLAYAKFMNSLFNDKKKTEPNFRVFFYLFLLKKRNWIKIKFYIW